MTTALDLLQTDYISVDIKDTVSQLLGALKKAKEHYALVFNGKKYLGVVAKRFLLSSRIDPAKMKVSNIIKKRSKAKTQFYVPTLSPDTDIKEICKLMSTSDSHLLPVLEKGKVIGVVMAHDVVNEISKEYANITCKEFSPAIITASPEDDIFTAIQIFARKGIDHLPIVDKDNTIIGMVTMSDLLENPNFWGVQAQKLPTAASHQKGKRTGYQHGEKTKMTSLPIRNLLSRKPLCCTPPDTKVPAAVELMKKNDVCSIILIKNNKPVGIFTIKDLLIDYAK
ncbi:MAG: CBS domain-containing protein [Candidatus Woesearchaeota archaeon]